MEQNDISKRDWYLEYTYDNCRHITTIGPFETQKEAKEAENLLQYSKTYTIRQLDDEELEILLGKAGSGSKWCIVSEYKLKRKSKNIG